MDGFDRGKGKRERNVHMYFICSSSVIHDAWLICSLFIPKKAARNPSGSYIPSIPLSHGNDRKGFDTHKENRHKRERHDCSPLLHTLICSR